tara:strand:- start:436 stop:657 length:222 start_codon:yes stop_codon:yes gene_type:complete
VNVKYVIVQDRTTQDKKGRLKSSEVLLAYPDTLINAKTRISKWKSVLEIKNIRLRKATMNDYPKTKKQKRLEK